mmetsp:Transcript_7120/g.6397  ORF Transcript_7120/g.6397 Transcript_7120/m.6397 type:complete len:91 (-) Transcript_7120:973-1245(-)
MEKNINVELTQKDYNSDSYIFYVLSEEPLFNKFFQDADINFSLFIYKLEHRIQNRKGKKDRKMFELCYFYLSVIIQASRLRMDINNKFNL